MKKKISLQEMKQIEINILLVLDNLCKKYNLKYSLFAGTLLGAVRHQGFIPWDDDIDICMTRKNYDKLREICSNGALPKRYLLLHEDLEGYHYPFCKIVDTQTFVEERDVKGPEVNGVWVDIFPLDHVPENRFIRRKIYLKCFFWTKMHYFSKSKKILIGKINFKKYIKIPLVIVAKLLGTDYCSKRLVSLSKKCKSLNKSYYACTVWLAAYCPMKVEEYETLTRLDFEGYSFSVIEAWNRYLELNYGNYMELPPENERVSHPINAYRI